MEKSKKIFLIFTAAFLGIILLVGIVLGAIAAIKSSGAVMKYKGIYLGEGVANYLSASAKNSFIQELNLGKIYVTDEESFWQSEAHGGKTYGDLLTEYTERYLMSVMVGAYLFDRNSRYTKQDKEAVNRAIDEVLYYRAENSTARFDELGSEMGFTFKDFKKAAELLYKYEKAESVIFGDNGESLAGGGFDAECNEYFISNYSKVRLMFIRTDGKWEYDSDLEKDVFISYSDVEKERVLEKIADIREKISDGRMNEDAFIWHIENDYPTGTPNDTDGYYFAKNSSYTRQFMEEGEEDGADKIVDIALAMKNAEYSECELEMGTCFIYKCEIEDGAYSSSALSRFFEDFYKLARPFVYANATEVFFSDVKVYGRYNPANVVTQPRNSILGVVFG